MILEINPSLKATTSLASSCRQIHAEYRPLYFAHTARYQDLYSLSSFLQTFFAGGSVPLPQKGDTPDYICHIFVLATPYLKNIGPTVDIKWLLQFLAVHKDV